MNIVTVSSFLMVWCIYAVDSGELLEYEVPGQQCSFIATTTDQYKVFTVVDTDGNYQSSASCMISFRTDEGKRFFLRLTSMDMEFSSQCSTDALLIYDGATEEDNPLTGTSYGICGRSLSLPNYFYSTSNAVSIKFVTDDANNDGDGFEILISAYTEVASEDECSNGFKCLSSNKCMSQDVYCNGNYQCSDASDEPANCSLDAAHGIIRANWILVGFISAMLIVLLL